MVFSTQALPSGKAPELERDQGARRSQHMVACAWQVWRGLPVGACFAHSGLRQLSGPGRYGGSSSRSVSTGWLGCAGVMLTACPGSVPGAAFAAGAPSPASGPSPQWGDTGLRPRHTCTQSRHWGSHPDRGTKGPGFLRNCLSKGRLLCQREGKSTKVLFCQMPPRPFPHLL